VTRQGTKVPKQQSDNEPDSAEVWLMVGLAALFVVCVLAHWWTHDDERPVHLELAPLGDGQAGAGRVDASE
jgi:hypothetical protein